MVPIVVDSEKVRIALVGSGPQIAVRLEMLRSHGVKPVAVYSTDSGEALRVEGHDVLIARFPTDEDLRAVDLIFAGGLSEAQAATLEQSARRAKALINVEDVRAHCDFHVPATIRRGDLLMTVSTGGASPGLASRIAARLGEWFGPEWAARLSELAQQRACWRAAGHDLRILKQNTDRYIDQKGWLT